MTDIKSMTLSELENFITENGYPKFRAKQIQSWLSNSVTSFDEMKNIPTALKDFLKTSSYISVANIEKKLVSRYDKTVKYLFSFNDGECVESVAVKWAVPSVQQAKADFHAVLHRRKCLRRLNRHRKIWKSEFQTSSLWEWENRLTTSIT